MVNYKLIRRVAPECRRKKERKKPKRQKKLNHVSCYESRVLMNMQTNTIDLVYIFAKTATQGGGTKEKMRCKFYAFVKRGTCVGSAVSVVTLVISSALKNNNIYLGGCSNDMKTGSTKARGEISGADNAGNLLDSMKHEELLVTKTWIQTTLKPDIWNQRWEPRGALGDAGNPTKKPEKARTRAGDYTAMSVRQELVGGSRFPPLWRDTHG